MDKNSIINLKLKEISNRQVAKTLKLDRKTVARYWNELYLNLNTIAATENHVNTQMKLTGWLIEY